MAVNTKDFKSKLIWDCAQALSQLDNKKRVTLMWESEHDGHRRKEKADRLARIGSIMAVLGPELSCGIAKSGIRA